MTKPKHIRRFTGWHMAMIFGGAFAVIIGANVTMARFASSTFSGQVVENSYVASQQYNDWLKAAREENTLGWHADMTRIDDGHLAVTVKNAPENVTVHAQIRRAIGNPERLEWDLIPKGPRHKGLGHFTSGKTLPEGRLLIRLTLTSGADIMHIERPIG